MEGTGPSQESAVATTDEASGTPDLFSNAGARLGRLERLNIAAVRRTFTSPVLDAFVRFCQRTVGAGWIDAFTSKIRIVRGLERLPDLREMGSFILVTNHRSYFDLFVVSMVLIRAGLRRRMLYPVRSTFFYDNPLGFFVNGTMSFWSMYPPIFRERRKMALNHTAISEIVWFLKNRGLGAAIHPEGTRKKDDDPYTFLPAQSGVGRAIYQSRVPVLPAFINGLGNDLPKQVRGNFDGSGRQVIVVFGAPVDFGALLEGPATAKNYRAIAERTLEVIGALGQEEKALRAELEKAKET